MTATINASTSSGLIQTADTSGELALQSNGTTKLTVASTGVAITGASLTSFAGGAITGGTAVASTSGTSIDFTSIPSWVKRITVMFNNVSLSGTSSILVQIGNTTPTTTGYSSITSFVTNNAGYGTLTSTSGFPIQGGDAAYSSFGALVITNISGNIWTANGNQGNTTSSPFVISSAGIVSLASALNMVRITTVNGTNTFDAGSINILYEG
jgi:hypothetical protein